MALEYSSAPGNERFSPPNPLKLQNTLLIAGGSVFLLLGLVLLFLVRGDMANSEIDAFGGMLVSMVMMGVGIAILGWAFTHLRFWFGRERPNNLDGLNVRELMRQRALAFQEPQGALNGLLYSWIHDLIYSPPPLQALAQRQFRNALTMLALAISLTVALLAGRSVVGVQAWDNVSQWMGLVYLGFALKLLLSGTGMTSAATPGAIGRNSLVFLLAFAVAGPVLLSLVSALLPPLPWSPYPHVYLLLGAALTVYVLFFAAVLRQANAAPQTEVSCRQEAWNINCQPNILIGEFSRYMQANWRDQIPNRLYIHTEPKVSVDKPSGDFTGEMMEETQPFPMRKQPLSFAGAWNDSRQKALLILDGVGLLCLLAAAGLLFWSGWHLRESDHVLTGLIDGGMLLSLGYFAFMASHALWKRFDFDSRVIWLEMEGSYVAADMEHGNLMRDTIKTRSSVVQIQSMTFRLWVARLNTVTFGVRADRHIIGMAGESGFAEALTRHLHEFARNHAVILAPTAQADLERHAALTKMNEMGRAGTPAAADMLPHTSEQGDTVLLPTDTPAAAGRAVFCSRCGTRAAADDAFCKACGHALKA